MKRWWRLLSALVLLVPFLPAGSPALGSQAPRCFTVTASEWTQNPPDRLAPFLRIPPHLRLLNEPGRSGPETGRSLVRPRQALSNRQSWAYWKSHDSTVQVSFINEVATIDLTLYERSWGLSGLAVARPSVPGFEARRNVRLEAAPCQ